MHTENTRKHSRVLRPLLIGMAMGVVFSTLQRGGMGEALTASLHTIDVLGTGGLPLPSVAPPKDDPILRQAEKLRHRLLRESTFVPSVGALRGALAERQALLRHRLVLTLDAGEASPPPWEIILAEHPHWLELSLSLLSAHYTVSRPAIEEALRQEEVPGIPRPSDIVAEDIRQDGKVLRVSITGTAQQGYSFDPADAAERIAEAIEQRASSVSVPSRIAGGNMLLTLQDGQTKTLALLSSGKSNFARSPADRVWNIRKALNEHVSGVVVPAGERFSFNDTLGEAVSTRRGWREALGIFGTSLSKTPGGGICQASTTTYRAILLAGLPVLKRRSHSLYVSYYEKYGVGIDATVFMGSQDLAFVNDTQDEIVLRAFTEGDEAYVDMYGVPDGRRVVLEGPYFSTTTERPVSLRKLSQNEIAWVQSVEYPDGQRAENAFYSYYQKGIPSKVKAAYAQPIAIENIQTVHAAAPEPTASVPAFENLRAQAL